MTTELLDSTISKNPQELYSVEYVEPQKNPIATVQTDVKNLTSANPLFDFNATHNGEACIESFDPKDRGTERQFRFTRALLCTLLGVKSENTITNHIDALINRGVVNDVKNLTSLNIKNENGNGAVKTTLYDLKVFNYLVMRLDTDQAWEKKAKFNDVLVERETGVKQEQPNTQPQPALPTTYLEALEALVASEKAKLALQAERDEAIRTKAQIGSTREATAMATASAKSKECEKLREQIGDSKTYKAAKSIPWLSEYFNTRNRGLYNSLAAKLKKIEVGMPPKFAHIKIDDSQYGEIKAYHIDVIEKLHEMVQADEEFMKDYRKDVSPKTKNA